jgi:hypothetical protein
LLEVQGNIKQNRENIFVLIAYQVIIAAYVC